jgi:chromosome segregation ATPase
MSMVDPNAENVRAGSDLVTWLHDQVGGLKTQMARVAQQGEQMHAAMLDVNEKVRDAESRLRELTARTMGLPVMQDQVRQLTGLLDRIQDAEVLIDTKFEVLERQTHEETARDQAEKNELYRRVQELERRSDALHERQMGTDDAGRRFQEEVSRSHIGFQQISQRLEAVEGKSSRNVEATTRLEQSMAEIESAVRALRREDDVLAERARLAHEVAMRVDQDLHAIQEETRAIPMLAERVELLRAERQRLEDRVSRAEESLADATVRLERQEEGAMHLDLRMKSHEGRMDTVHQSTLDFRRSLSDHVLKLNQMIERMKRRQVEEMERDIKELRGHSNQLKNENDEF